MSMLNNSSKWSVILVSNQAKTKLWLSKEWIGNLEQELPPCSEIFAGIDNDKYLMAAV